MMVPMHACRRLSKKIFGNKESGNKSAMNEERKRKRRRKWNMRIVTMILASIRH